MMINLAINLATAAIGLLLASWWVPGVTLQVSGFVLAVAVYTVAAALFGPFVFSMARKYASALLGGIGLVAPQLARWVATRFPGGRTNKRVTPGTSQAASSSPIAAVARLIARLIIIRIMRRC